MADWNAENRQYQGQEHEEEEEGIISQEDCWSVIQSYFDENVFNTPGSNRKLTDSPLFKHKLLHSMSSYKIRYRN
jgi:hypothetical protein